MPTDSQHPPQLNSFGRRPTWAEIDLDALAHNFHLVQRQVGRDIAVMGVVKANAYGHGAVQCARRLSEEGATWFGVATPEEAIELRQSGLTKRILSLGGFWEGQAAACLQQRITPVVYRLDLIEVLNGAAHDAGLVADVHVKIDTGMGRLGVRYDQLNEFAQALKQYQSIRVDGLMTHIAAADDHACEPLTTSQIERFGTAVELFRAHGFSPTYRHLANSAAIFDQRASWGNMVRPGGVLYGLWRDVLAPHAVETEGAVGQHLKPVLSVRSRITMLKWVPAGETIGYGCTYEASRPTLVATLPIGYNDGYLRGLSNRGRMIIRGTYASVIGRVSMDLTLVDVTNVPGVELNDAVTVLGTAPDARDLLVAAEDLAKTAGTLSYEVTCGIGPRIPRIYL